MFKKLCALLLAFALLGTVQACSMPDAIFGDDAFTEDQQDEAVAELDIYSFDFSLDGDDFALPVAFTALTSRGWKVAGDVVSGDGEDAAGDVSSTPAEEETPAATSETILEGQSFSDYLPVTKEGLYVGLKFYNKSKKDAPLKDCTVVGLRLDPSYGKEPPFHLHGEEMSVGTQYEKVIALCGKPSYTVVTLAATGEILAINDVKFTESEEGDSSTLYYKLDENSFYAFDVTGVDGDGRTLKSLIMENDCPLEKAYDYSREIKYKPAEIDLYTGPNLLGKQFTDFAFKYDGNLYTLPIPVRKLLSDGWQFARGYGERVPSGSTADGVIMRKGNMAILLKVHNYDLKYSLTAVNCYAVSLEACLTGPNVDIMLSKGVTLGSTESDLVDAFGKNYAKTHPVAERNSEEEADSAAPAAPAAKTAEEAGTVTDKYDIPDMPGCSIEKTVGEEFTVYSCVMPDDVPTVTLPVSITDIGDTGLELLGGVRKHIDVYVDNKTGLVTRFYLQNCPEYIVDEDKIIQEQLEAAREKEKEEREKQEKEQAEANNKG